MITSILRTTAGFLGVVTLSLTLAAQPARAEVDINSVTVDFDAATITIAGEGFFPDGIAPEATLAGGTPLGFDLVISTFSDTEIVAELPAAIEDGDYRLEVTSFEYDVDELEDDSGEFDLTIGAVGPAGADGADGATGATGADGAGGAIVTRFPVTVTVSCPNSSFCGATSFCAAGDKRTGCAGSCNQTSGAGSVALGIIQTGFQNGVGGIQGCLHRCFTAGGVSSPSLGSQVQAFCAQ